MLGVSVRLRAQIHRDSPWRSVQGTQTKGSGREDESEFEIPDSMIAASFTLNLFHLRLN